MIAWVLLLTIIYFIAWHFYDRYQENKYPENVREILKGKYAAINAHRAKIRRIRRLDNKYNIFAIKSFKLFGHVFFDLSYRGYRTVKHQRYLINKKKREIKGIKEHYNK